MGKPDPHLPQLRIEKLPHLPDCPLQISKYIFHPVQKQLANRGQLQITSLLHKQRHSQLLLQLVHLAADGGLGHMKLLGSLGNMLLLRNLDKVVQLSKLHGSDPFKKSFVEL
ncbi:hypothetical protein D3C75_1185790 [compost metagenome]